MTRPPDLIVADRISKRYATRSGAVEALRAIYPRTGKAFVIGVTGTPGAGKSTLVDELVVRLRARGDRVGVVAVDPSSPFSGGAILGDRIRMQRHALDEEPAIFAVSSADALLHLERLS